MSKYNILELWDEFFPGLIEVDDYAGRRILKSACSNPNSKYHPTIDHIRPLSKGGKDIKGNIEICHYETNNEKDDTFSTWNTNDRTFQAKRVKGTKDEYEIYEVYN